MKITNEPIDTNPKSNWLGIFGTWIQAKFSCTECRHLRNQVSLLQDELERSEELFDSSENERRELQSQLLDLLNPIRTPKAEQKPILGMRTWRSFVGDRKKLNRSTIKVDESIPDLPTPHEPIEEVVS